MATNSPGQIISEVERSPGTTAPSPQEGALDLAQFDQHQRSPVARGDFAFFSPTMTTSVG